MLETTVPHPARYSDSLFRYFARHLRDRPKLLDPMAGVGKISQIRTFGFTGTIVCNELEPEWASQCSPGVDLVTTADAKALPFLDQYFDAVCTSPTYGNRMADHHVAKDGSRRNTYRHTLGRALHKENTGQMQWGDQYREHHHQIWQEVWRVLKPNGVFLLNVSDHVRKGEIIPVSDWHKDTVLALGFALEQRYQVETPRQRYGANGALRVEHEDVFVFLKPS